MGRSARTANGRCDLVKPGREFAATELTEWLEGVLADPAFASAVEKRGAEMRAEQRREVLRARDLLRHGPVPPGEARSRRRASTKRREQARFVVVTPCPNPSATARRFGLKASDIVRVDEVVEARRERDIAKSRSATSSSKRRPG